METTGIFCFVLLMVSICVSDCRENSLEMLVKDNQCFVYEESLTCNTVPHNIPDNITRIILLDIKDMETIQKGTFDGTNWENIKYLKIAITPGLQKNESQKSSKPTSHSKRRIKSLHAKAGIEMLGKSENNKMSLTSQKTTDKTSQKTTDKTSQKTTDKTSQKTTDKTFQKTTDKYIKTIEPYALENLKSLEELHIASSYFENLNNESFFGLDRLTVLSFVTCEKLKLETITKAMNGSNTFPYLQNLTLAYINVEDEKGIIFGKYFLRALSSKPLKELNLHKLNVRTVELRYIDGLFKNSVQYLRLSSCTLNQVDTTATQSLMFKQLKILDVSSVVLPMDMLRFIRFLPISNLVFPLDMENTTMLTNIEMMDLSNIYHSEKPIELYNITVMLINNDNKNWQTKELILKHNKLRYLDVMIPCKNSSLEKIDLSYNGIEFLQPNICQCCYRLKRLDLSYNKLYQMYKTNFSLLSLIFSQYPNLQQVYLIGNDLTNIPDEMFIQSNMLQVIDLSINQLTQVYFYLSHLKNLQLLNLQHNRIAILDQVSLNFLTSIKPTNTSGVFDLRNNPVSCSSCSTLQSVQWLSSSPDIIHSSKGFVCHDASADIIPIDHSALRQVQSLCDKPRRIRRIILQATLTAVVSLTFIIVTVLIIIKYRRHKKYKADMDERLRLIQGNEMDTEFVVFLSFSSNDNDFIQKYVYNQLNNQLQNMVKTDRDLVTFGDKHFRLGRPINDEMVRSLEQCAVVIILLSRNFCFSEFCRMEFDHALRMEKPIIFMLKEEIYEEEMVPSLYNIFRKNTRIMWEKHGDEFQLKTSWDNVCTSILELIPH